MQNAQSSVVYRPIWISVVCVYEILGILGFAMAIWSIRSNSQRVIRFEPAWQIPETLGCIASIVGLWSMRKWSVFLYGITLAANEIRLVVEYPRWSILNFFISLLLIAICLVYYPKMR